MNWQPIKTCPKGLVILYFPPHKPDPRGMFQLDAKIEVGQNGTFNRKPTHWMPIPPLPESA